MKCRRHFFTPQQQRRSCSDCGTTQERSFGEPLTEAVPETPQTPSAETVPETSQVPSSEAVENDQTETVSQSQIQLNCGTVKVLPLTLKKSIKLTAFGLSSGDSVVSWTSSNKKVATVSKSGTVTAKKTGTTNITVTLKSGATASVKVKVQKQPVTTKKITVSTGKKTTVAAGKKKVIKTAVTPITSLDKVKFQSSNKKVASVNSKGVVKGLKKGTATITAKSGKKTAKVKVTVK